METWFERSAPGRFLNTLGMLPVRLLAPLAAGKVRAGGPLRPRHWVLALGLAGMLCVPHEAWNNLYGVLFAFVALALYWWDCAAERRQPLSPAALGPGVWAFLTVCLLVLCRAGSAVGHLRILIFLLTGFTLAYLTAASMEDEGFPALLCGSVTAVLVLTAVYGLLRYALGTENYFVPMSGRLYPRLGSTLEHGINYSEFTAMALPVSLVWAAGRKGRKRVLLLLLLLPPCAAVLLTYARTGWVALAAALVVLLWFYNKKLLIPAVIAGVAAVFLLPAGIQERLLSMLQFNDAGSSGRFTLWSECLRMLRDHWLLGVGLGPENFYPVYQSYSTGALAFQPPHANMGYLEIFLSVGAAGFAAYLSFFLGILFRLGKARRAEQDPGRLWLNRALTASLTAAAVANVPEHLWFYPRILFFWCMIFGMAVGISKTPKDD